jgi:hypothetical protein
MAAVLRLFLGFDPPNFSALASGAHHPATGHPGGA